MLVVALNQAKPPGATEATVFGPFHVDDAPAAAQGADIAGGAPGTPLFVDARVLDLQGRPIAGAEVDVWQADDEGLYDVQRPELGSTRRARGVLRSDAEGRVRFRSIMPTPYPVPTDGPVGQMLLASGRHPWRPAHLHFLIRADGLRDADHAHLPRPRPLPRLRRGVRRALVADRPASSRTTPARARRQSRWRRRSTR